MSENILPSWIKRPVPESRPREEHELIDTTGFDEARRDIDAELELVDELLQSPRINGGRGAVEARRHELVAERAILDAVEGFPLAPSAIAALEQEQATLEFEVERRKIGFNGRAGYTQAALSRQRRLGQGATLAESRIAGAPGELAARLAMIAALMPALVDRTFSA